MTTYYVKSGSSNTAPHDTWAKAATTLMTAVNAAAAGDTIYVSHQHTDTYSGSATIAKTGATTRILCVNDGAEPPTALATTAVFGTTSQVLVGGDIYIYGIYFKPQSSSYINGDGYAEFESCTIRQAGVATYLFLGSQSSTGVASRTRFLNCTFRVSNIGNVINLGRGVTFQGCTMADTGDSSVVPTTLMPLTAPSTPSAGHAVTFLGCDFSQITSGKTMFGAPVAMFDIYLIDCKLPASDRIVGAFSSYGAANIYLKNSGDANNNYQYGVRGYAGNIDIDIAQYITLTSNAGASDGDIGYSWKMAGNANTTKYQPLRSEWVYMRYATTGAAKTATVEILYDGAASLTDDEVWVEFGALTDSTSSLASTVSGRCGILAQAAAHAAGVGIGLWTKGTAGTGWISQKLVTPSFTPQKKGYVMARVCVGANKTVYVNPNLVIA